ncbi:oligopeptide transport system permease protein [Actinokineospora alba]|uniref:Oligopeptide transport system permease protein n=1 Tax=Actinokineospora alba TaxID=504798 RepID=A0A1H0RXU6_9PSEU|nr:ABC transporter permease [Actinokineospora alba]TDP66867.1 oligopeptide transport system permease protein [Actinokineospora alba]SDI47881.1 oligopeptide transport system permease protein [Actinokineospora alba]SDP34294.1 oligopeptide transport system permease protein [Actinokineospora alba]
MTDPSTAATGAAVTTTASDSVTAAEHVETAGTTKPRSLASDAWHDLRRRPLFIISGALILFIVVMAAVPFLFTSVDPNFADLGRSRNGPSAEAWFGYDLQGRDIFARTIYGTRASLIVGICATVLTVLIGGTLGLLAGFYGGWIDGLMSRIADVFFGLPFVLGAIVILSSFRATGSTSVTEIMFLVIVSISLLSWPVCMRIMRSAAITAKQQDYVKAARALGANSSRIILRHMLPNAVAPVLVYATIALGAFIGAEASLSFLGLGLRDPVVSWGVMISGSRDYIRVAPHLLLFPAAFLTATVLAFVMLGDAVREALDPKMR